ncbi:diaminopimelate decarboxylase [Pueribacillus theae]|uniref:Diaminopimelate decarboxylase n=1 Tax=Pueribacillus theae TaxID=2171751 RepID=A0A2U1K700_9BACI|nr:diaminopimelate decarboxylase [Pueribacillus theae]PWA13162.1 diaminopimelate decarboxylase [Pueribacillus theae]
MQLHGTSTIDHNGHLSIGGVDTVQLAKRYGTPLFVYDVALIRQKANEFKKAFDQHGIGYQIAYASKAFSCIAMIQLAEEEGLSLDVVSGGELHTALVAGFPPERIHFHGNNKSLAEIEMGMKAGIGCFVVDNFYEIKLLEETAKKHGKIVPVLIRTTPGIEAHTHDYILTGQEDSKFGFDLKSGQAEKAINQLLHHPNFRLLGLHCHIGSQIFETTGFIMATKKLFVFIERLKAQLGYTPDVLNVGGGFGIRYTEEDNPIPLSHYVNDIIHTVKEEVHRIGCEMPEIWIEPGRSLVGDAGTTLYTIGSEKTIPSIRQYLAVDGGMTDNLRPALYQAKYEGILANRANEKNSSLFSIAGKACESGDMLIWDLPLPEPNHGDLLAVFSTGAYGYAMSNNYNRIPRPAVVFVENGESQLVIKRETYEDLLSHDLPIKNALTNS